MGGKRRAIRCPDGKDRQRLFRLCPPTCPAVAAGDTRVEVEELIREAIVLHLELHWRFAFERKRLIQRRRRVRAKVDRA